jgi:hypothetical protein
VRFAVVAVLVLAAVSLGGGPGVLLAQRRR